MEGKGFAMRYGQRQIQVCTKKTEHAQLHAGQTRVAAHSLGSMVAQKFERVQKRPNICFWSSANVPAPCFTDFGRNHS